jgi:hypothetical protein
MIVIKSIAMFTLAGIVGLAIAMFFDYLDGGITFTL